MQRGFTVFELVIVGTIAAVVAAAAVAMTVKTSDDLNNAQDRMGVLEFIQRERNSHVNRAVDNEVIVVCAAVGAGPCTDAGGDTLVAYRSPVPPVVFPAPLGSEIARTRFKGITISFVPVPALYVDAFARSVDGGGVPRDTVVNMLMRGAVVEDIVFRDDGFAVPSFDAPSNIEVTPLISDIGSRATPNPTPAVQPNTSYPARKVYFE